MKAFIFFCFTAIFISAQTQAQDSIVDQDIKVNSQIWLDYNFTNAIDDDKILRTQAGFRKIYPNVYNRFLVISTLDIPHNKPLKIFNLKNALIHNFQLGAGLIYTQNYEADDNLEFRLVQGTKFKIPLLKGIVLINYLRIEERFQTKFNGSGWHSGFRFRYKISTILDWKKQFLPFIEGFYIPLSVELFFNLKKSDQFNDVVRIEPGIGYKLKNDWRFELHGIFNQTKNSTENDTNTSDFIIRLRVFSGNSNLFSKKKPILPEEESEN
ncbi:MAG: DUF2490 domain-containing protein [Flavobacteriaceae bacterium]|nr:DUF2490 domain-containing protein [Flavobacteriaceae bacterium]